MKKDPQLAALKKQVAPFESADLSASIRQLFNTLIPFFGLWYLAYKSLDISYALTLAIDVVLAFLTTRIFILFHDCCHFSFFKSRRANKIVGALTGVLTFFPYHQWQHDHSVHHATSGNLDKRGTGDIWMLTVDEYAALSPMKKLGYRLYRNPLVLFGLGQIWVFLIKNRFNKKGARLEERLNVYFTNIALTAIIATLCYTIGWKDFLLVQAPIFWIAGVAGIWLFYVQHTFEDSYFEPDPQWSYVLAAVEGSSFYKLPKVLQWLTGNIGYHHIHHLAPRVPNYKLEAAHNAIPEMKHVPTVTLSTSFESLRFRLWDEEKKKFVGYKAANDKMKVSQHRTAN